MSLRKLPDVKNFVEPDDFESIPSVDAVNHWLPGLVLAADSSGARVIEILQEIGKDPWTGEGVDAQDVSAQLKGAGDVLVIMNTLGGSFSQAVTIYNLLKGHAGKVTIKVIGMAASAGSVIAMAGDDILMGPAAFMMIHNGQGICQGDRHAMENAATNLSAIDAAIRDLYVARTGKHANSIAQMMDNETMMNASDAIKFGFADGLIARDQITEDVQNAIPKHALAAKKFADVVFAHAGVPRSRRREIYAAIKAGPIDPVLSQAAEQFEGLRNEMQELKSLLHSARLDDAPKWICPASSNLALDTSESWDGPAAADRMLAHAGYGSASMNYATARRGFLFCDTAHPDLKASYKDPFADMVGGELKAVRGGIRAAASRLPQTSDIPADVANQARHVVQHYEERFAAASGADGTQNAAEDVQLHADVVSAIADDLRGFLKPAGN